MCVIYNYSNSIYSCHDSSVGIVLRPRAGKPKNRRCFPDTSSKNSLSLTGSVTNAPVVHPTSYFTSKTDCFAGCKEATA
jgi:hypothetical protein